MDMEKVNLHRIPSQPLIYQKQRPKNIESPQRSFIDHFNQATKPMELKVSKHATERLKERNIQISTDEWALITEKVNEAKAKGVQDSLVLLEQAALIISAKNSTIITAMDRIEAKNQLFTNLDGTIVLG